MENRILVIDDELSIQQALKGALEDEGLEVVTVGTGEDGLARFWPTSFDLVLLDVWLPGMDGLEVLRTLKQRDSQVEVIMISGHGTIETAVKATKMGAYDFIEKPISLDKLLVTINNALAYRQLEESHLALQEEVEGKEELIGHSPAIREVISLLERVAPSDGSILIVGENGTGKEVVARTIHRSSLRQDNPFLAVNCAAIPEDLIESELFGYEKGAFTGAYSRKKGRFELAHQGTLFLDEIGDMSLKTQAKILRTLEERSFERLGGTDTLKVDVRLIAATNKNLEAQIEKGDFREDLYYRISVIPVNLPPLRERKADIPLFVSYFLDKFNRRLASGRKSISSAATQYLSSYHWPGNVRELKNIIERLVIVVAGEEIGLADLPGYLREKAGAPPSLDATDLRDARRVFERNFILEKLNDNDWNVSKTARALNIQRSHLHHKMKSLKIEVTERGKPNGHRH